MLTNNRNPSFSYARRLVVLPLLGMVVVLFSFRNKEEFKTLSLASVMGNVMNVKLEESPALVNFIRRKKIEPVNIENTAASFFYQRLTDKAAPVSGPLHLQKIAPQNAVSSNDTNYGRPRDWIFQGIANDPLGNVARSRMVYIRDLILQGSATGTEVWTETHVVTTDDEGKFIIYPGKGLAVPPAISVDIMKIDWSRGPFFLYMMTAVSPSIPAPWWLPSNNYNSMGTIELKESESAPQTIQFALDFTKTAGRDIKLEPNTTSTIEVPIAGVKKGDPILVKWNKEHVNWAIYSAWVSEDNRITVRFANYTDETINVSGSEYKIVAIR